MYTFLKNKEIKITHYNILYIIQEKISQTYIFIFHWNNEFATM